MAIMIERRLGTAPFWMPIERGWTEPVSEIVIADSLTPADLQEHNGLVLVDTLLASTALNASYVLTNFAVAAATISLLTMVSSERPDGIAAAVVGVPDVSLTGRAVAEIVIPEFYGITATDWRTEPTKVGPSSILVTEDQRALLPTASESDFHEDLGRAWFLMTETHFVSQLCLVSAEYFDSDREGVRQAVHDLYALLDAAASQRRMLRRNISRDYDIDREVVVDVFDGLKFELTGDGVAGLRILFEQTGVLRRVGPLDRLLVSVDRS